MDKTLPEAEISECAKSTADTSNTVEKQPDMVGILDPVEASVGEFDAAIDDGLVDAGYMSAQPEDQKQAVQAGIRLSGSGSPGSNGKIVYPLPKGKRAKIDSKQRIIIESCENVFDQLKGKLVAKGKRYNTLMVTSVNPQDGVTVSAIATAVGLSRYGQSTVLLIDANSDNRGVSLLFSLTGTTGFFEYMSGKDCINYTGGHGTIADAMVSSTESPYRELQDLSWTHSVFYTEYNNLFVMPFARETNVSLWDLIERVDFSSRLSALCQYFDFVVIDSPAVMKSSEAQILSGYLDGVILVIRAEKTKWEVAKIALANIENAGGKVIGSILNRRKFYIPKILYGWM